MVAPLLTRPELPPSVPSLHLPEPSPPASTHLPPPPAVEVLSRCWIPRRRAPAHPHPQKSTWIPSSTLIRFLMIDESVVLFDCWASPPGAGAHTESPRACSTQKALTECIKNECPLGLAMILVSVPVGLKEEADRQGARFAGGKMCREHPSERPWVATHTCLISQTSIKHACPGPSVRSRCLSRRAAYAEVRLAFPHLSGSTNFQSTYMRLRD